MRLREKVAIITGAGSGIGAGCALAFAREGARVVVADINDVAGNSVAEEIKTKGAEASFVHVDVMKRDDLRRMIQVAVDSYGRLDLLLNNAGTHIPQGTEACTEETWDFLMTLNLKSMWRAVQEALPELKKTNGNILNMGSDVGLVGQADAVAYCASKGGIIAMTKAMA
ncbi:MAG: SDR family NAD(P)-dependent oxidoreductase, partial [Armatimonadetes bacterium]|nr:SDR family NAD(P)-dependent oxidoreductase [Armatimonadota bacterium]